MFFNHKRYAQEAERHRQKKAGERDQSFGVMLFLGILASFGPTRLFLRLHPRKVAAHFVQETPHALHEQVPIIYIHGFRGGDYTTNLMLKRACQVKDNPKFLKVTADLFGNFKLEGTWTNDAHPLVQLVFKQKIVGFYAITYYLRFILPFLSQKFKFHHYDAIAHSLGAPAIVKTEMKTSHRKNFPRLKRCALLAGPYDGVMYLGDLPNINHLNTKGCPVLMTPAYVDMLWHRRQFNPKIQVLNIYGNILDETNTDRFISVISAKSIRYILAPVVKTFQEVEIRGKDAEHSELHDSPFVSDIIYHFIHLQD